MYADTATQAPLSSPDPTLQMQPPPPVQVSQPPPPSAIQYGHMVVSEQPKNMTPCEGCAEIAAKRFKDRWRDETPADWLADGAVYVFSFLDDNWMWVLPLMASAPFLVAGFARWRRGRYYDRV